MSLSEAQVHANRENAKHSTGPRSEDGKKKSSLNALRHGLTSAVDVLPSEDMQAYLALHEANREFWQPANLYEESIVKRITSHDWRLNRCSSLENGMFALGHEEFGNEVDPGNTQVHAALTASRAFMENPRALEALSRHEARIYKMRQEAIKEMKEAQAQRRGREEAQMQQAIPLYKAAKMKGLPYHPEEDGFVLQVSSIERHLRRMERRAEAQIAEKCAFNLEKFQAWQTA